ncbi:hypothetical protein [Streptomyces sp. NPDC005017]|uniref:hypothetical protein n=1 Tax=Streptomyces sp. NPDC005017 TaxID=3364706 RepID=UPI003699CCA0
MEQRIGSSSQPLDAGVNPAHIPGITVPLSKDTEETGPEDEAVAAAEDNGDDAETASEPSGSSEATGSPDAEDVRDAAESGEAPADGPVFEAADRRARIVADSSGVRLALDDQECEFRWDEVGAIESESPRFGKRFTVTVHTPDRRWYPIEIEAGSRSQHRDWETELDAVLDAYFEE